MNLMVVPGMFVCSSFLTSVCMFIVSKAFVISSATLIVRTGGAIWLNPFATVLFSVCSAVTVECCFLYPCCMGVFGMFAVPTYLSSSSPECHFSTFYGLERSIELPLKSDSYRTVLL